MDNNYSAKELEVLNIIETRMKNQMDDPDIAKENVSNRFHAINDVSDRLKNDKTFMLDVIKCNGNIYGFALQYASDNLKNDPYVVLEAVKKKSLVFMYASEEIKKIVGDNDPVEALEAYIKSKELSEKFNSILPNIEQSQAPKRKPKL